MFEKIPVYELHVKPTYAVCLPQRSTENRVKSIKQIQNEKNLEQNDNAGVISAKASKRLTNAVNWLVASAKSKSVFDKKTGKTFNFKINFITLTLPTLGHNVSDHHFKAVMLHAFINNCRYKYGMQNFVWKVEAQANGNIHAHFTTDVYIPWQSLRRMWNKILTKNGIIDIYHRKHKDLSFDQYYRLYATTSGKSADALRKAYDYGVSTNWQDPNTTDVHAVHKVKDVGAYLAKYMSKSDADRRKISGRLWSCSYNLSDSNKLVIEMSHPDDFEYMQPLMNDAVKYKEIQHVSALTRRVFTVGEIFFYKLKDWGTILNGKLLEAFNKHRWEIRTGVDVQALRAVIKAIVPDPPHLILDTFFPDPQDLNYQLECPF